MSTGRPSQLVDDKERDDVAEPGAAASGLRDDASSRSVSTA